MMKMLYFLITITILSGCQGIKTYDYTVKDASEYGGKYFVSTISNINKIAVFVPTGKFDAPYRQIEIELMQGLRAKGYYIVSRGDVSSVIKEISFQQSGLTENEAARIGRILNVDAILIGEITNMVERISPKGNYYISNISMAARLINVETSNIMWVSCKTKRNSLLINLIMLPVNIFSGSNTIFDELTNSIIDEFPYRQ